MGKSGSARLPRGMKLGNCKSRSICNVLCCSHARLSAGLKDVEQKEFNLLKLTFKLLYTILYAVRPVHDNYYIIKIV